MSHYPDKFDFLMVGGGVFGLTAAIELAKRKYKIGLLNPDTIPHHLAASSDISKAVRMEYGSDTEYFRMVEICIDRWKHWNDLFGAKLYHEVGFLLLCKHPFESKRQSFEQTSCANLIKAGYALDRMDANAIKQRFPVVNTEVYMNANFNPKGGFADATLTIEKLANYATSLGVQILQGQTATELLIDKGQLWGVKTKEGVIYHCGHAMVTAGPYSILLLPELAPYMKATGHPVFWLKPKDPTPFTPPHLSVFSADLSNTGWYGFPWSDKYGIVKVAKHSNGVDLHPEHDDRQVTENEIIEMRLFLNDAFPALSEAPLVYTRRCLYTDTLDGHFWIDHHPETKGLLVGTGGSGHAFKMAPLLGEMLADVAEGGSNPFSTRHRWRDPTKGTTQMEEARYIVGGKI